MDIYIYFYSLAGDEAINNRLGIQIGTFGIKSSVRGNAPLGSSPIKNKKKKAFTQERTHKINKEIIYGS